MNIDEAKARVAAQDDKLKRLEDEFERLSTVHGTPVMMAMLRIMLEVMFNANGPNLVVHNKIKFYTGVIGLLQQKGFS